MYPTILLGEQICQYMHDYANHFGLMEHCRFGVTVDHIGRSEDGQSWAIRMTNKDSVTVVENFDKVLVANGSFKRAYTPKIDGIDRFKGRILHSQEFKE